MADRRNPVATPYEALLHQEPDERGYEAGEYTSPHPKYSNSSPPDELDEVQRYSVESGERGGLSEDVIEAKTATSHIRSTNNRALHSRAGVIPQKHGWFSRAGSFVADESWAPEIASWLVAAGSAAGILAILALYDGTPVTSWPLPITLNATVQVLLTLTRVSVAFLVGQGISQIKWIWYKTRERRAIDFEKFDNASRGPWGSVKLIASMRTIGSLSSLSILGALIIILTLAAAPVSQQSLQTVLKPVDNTRSSTALSHRATYFGAVDHYTLKGGVEKALDTSTEGALYAAMLAKKDSKYPHLIPHCSSGNCTWPKYQTLGVCASIADVSDRLDIICSEWDIYEQELSCSASFPDGPLYHYNPSETSYLVRKTGQRLRRMPQFINSTGQHVKSQAFRDVQDNSLIDFFVMWGQWGDKQARPSFKAIEINLQYCVQTLQTNVAMGEAYTQVTKEYTNFSSPEFAKWDWQHKPFNWTARPPGSNESFKVSWAAYRAFQATLALIFDGVFILENFDGTTLGYPTEGVKAIINAIYQSPHPVESLSTLAGNIATGLTNHMRSFDNDTAPVVGQTIILSQHVQVSWPWLTLLLFLVTASFVFLLLVIVTNHSTKSELWRSSSLALLRALDTVERPQSFTGLQRNVQMAEDAKDAKLRLEGGEEVWSLVTSFDRDREHANDNLRRRVDRDENSS